MNKTFCVDIVQRQVVPVPAKTVEEAVLKARAYLNTFDSSIEIEGVFADGNEMIWDEDTCHAFLAEQSKKKCLEGCHKVPADGVRSPCPDCGVGVTSYLPLADYAPNVTCPFCMAETSPAHGNEMHWDETTLTIQQTCPECGHRWNEEWELKSIRTVKDDELPPSKW